MDKRIHGLGILALIAGVSSMLITTAVSAGGSSEAGLTDKQALGKLLYFDKNLSINRNQSCASTNCRLPIHHGHWRIDAGLSATRKNRHHQIRSHALATTPDN